ncbi:Eco57I restriction-modification methylase domain-containing protein [Macrococcoides canis]|uniref:Eco57I restriction-modification methylase domain-containing protein n=1 Tax=Macrococcoides canis TaxID=1855823 RepID=UPI0020B70D9C|nr:hypothetical protein [Macrococcus canis]UTH11567.1 hypothetical protein KFV10_00150 [Macrococcus canis]
MSNLIQYIEEFKKKKLNNEDDVKIQFHANILVPLIKELNKDTNSQVFSESRYLKGGRADATFKNLTFEYKKLNYFDKKKGIDEAIYGRNTKDHGLYDYLISHAEIDIDDDKEQIQNKIQKTIGIGFDGHRFIFARFVPTMDAYNINTKKTNFYQEKWRLNLEFHYEVLDFENGLKQLALLLSQQDKMSLNKKNLLANIYPNSVYVKENIIKLYELLNTQLEHNSRIQTLYDDWDRVFGTLYGEETEETDFNNVTPFVKKLYNINSNYPLDSKKFLFALQTYFNIFLKLLVNSFLSKMINPTFNPTKPLSKEDIVYLFEGNESKQKLFITNFFEMHYLEWFAYSYSDGEEVEVVNSILELLNQYDVSSFLLKPENIQDILQEIYMELIPEKMRHLMGEYFSPDWIVEHVLDLVEYKGDIEKSLIDPTLGSGPFLTQALKRIIQASEGRLSRDQLDKIVSNLAGFDINPISVVAAKTNFILILLSAYLKNHNVEDFGEPIDIPIYIADSVLSPIVYSEESKDTVITKTVVGEFEIPKFKTLKDSNKFLRLLSDSIHEKARFEPFWLKVRLNNVVGEKYKDVVHNLWKSIFILHHSGKDSFWPIILKNSFAPVLLNEKFDFVVGNPPWIGWKSMSKSYRNGTLKVWKSYGIFEKNAYDKKTTHDDFGMAVTYVAIDQYLKEGGKLGFLLPASFLKSTKGGDGFRKFNISRNNQNIPFKITRVEDFGGVKLFTIPTIAFIVKKGLNMNYPMKEYIKWIQTAGKKNIDSHTNWFELEPKLKSYSLIAQPVDGNNNQSAWLTLPDMAFANKVLNPHTPRYYKGRKGVEPAGAKGVYILKKPNLKLVNDNGLKYLNIVNDMSRQRRKDLLEMGEQEGVIEESYIYPMLGGRNIDRWRVKSNEFIIVPHDEKNLYGIPENKLAQIAPATYEWLAYYYQGLLASRIQNGKYFNKETHPFYRLDNVGTYTFSKWKVLWKEQTGSMSAVVVGNYYDTVVNPDDTLFSKNKCVVVDSKVLMLDVETEEEAHYVCGLINTPIIREIIDGYAIQTNRGTDVLKYLSIPKFNSKDKIHSKISSVSKKIHKLARYEKDDNEISILEDYLNKIVFELYE